MRSRNFPSLVHALIALTCLFQFRLPLQAQDEPDELFVPRITISGAKVLAKVPLIDDPFLEIGVFPAHFRVRWTIGDPSIIRFFPIPNQSGDGFKASFNRPRTEATVEAKADSVEKERFVWVWGIAMRNDNDHRDCYRPGRRDAFGHTCHLSCRRGQLSSLRPKVTKP